MTVEQRSRAEKTVALVDLVDRLIGAGVVLTGDVVLSLAGVDLVYLVYLGLRLVLTPAHEAAGILAGQTGPR